MILGIDALMDMVRTSLNVLGNCLATVVIARWEGRVRRRGRRGPGSGSRLQAPGAQACPGPTNSNEQAVLPAARDRRRTPGPDRGRRAGPPRCASRTGRPESRSGAACTSARMRDAAGAAQRQQLLAERDDVVGQPHRLERRIEAARQPRALRRDAGRAVVGVAAQRLDAADREQRLAGDVDHVAPEGEGDERRVGEPEAARADEHDRVRAAPARRTRVGRG